jgi:hypothetical protein
MLLAGLAAGWLGWMGLFVGNPITLPVPTLTVTQIERIALELWHFRYNFWGRFPQYTVFSPILILGTRPINRIGANASFIASSRLRLPATKTSGGAKT